MMASYSSTADSNFSCPAMSEELQEFHNGSFSSLSYASIFINAGYFGGFALLIFMMMRYFYKFFTVRIRTLANEFVHDLFRELAAGNRPGFDENNNPLRVRLHSDLMMMDGNLAILITAHQQNIVRDTLMMLVEFDPDTQFITVRSYTPEEAPSPPAA